MIERAVCENCPYWNPPPDEGVGSARGGDCRRHAASITKFAEVYKDYWCGDHPQFLAALKDIKANPLP